MRSWMSSRKCAKRLMFVVAFLSVVFVFQALLEKKNHLNDPLIDGYSGNVQSFTQELPNYHQMTLQDVVKSRANGNRTIMLSLVDTSYAEMALNLYESSYKKLGLENYLFLCSDSESVQILESHNIASKQYASLLSGSHASVYRTKEFKEKVRIKIRLVYDVLKLGYNVLLVDLDIVLFKNPFKFFTCTSCDLEIQWDRSTINSGFFFVKPTPGGLAAFKEAYHEAVTTEKDDQIILHTAIYALRKSKKITFKVLNEKKFPCGKVYFEMGYRIFADDNLCTECVMYHNNWIVSREAKIYRFKELLHWNLDTEGYYSDTNAKYIHYENPVDFNKNNTLDKEINALKNALVLGHVLNRVVILPAFHCYGCKYGCRATTKWCSLVTNIQLTDFDKYFERKYREHMFLKHEKVPFIFKESMTNVANKRIALQTSKNKDLFHGVDSKSEHFLKTEEHFLSVENIKSWLKEFESQPILKCHFLYDIFDLETFITDNPHTEIAQGLKNGFKTAKPRQFQKI